MKRGLLDIIGKLGHSLFGLATDDDISRLQHLTEKTAGRQKIIIHNTREMLTIINKTLEFQEEIKVNMKTMREREQVLKEQLEVHGNVLKKMNLKVVSLSLARAVDRTIDQLELVYAEYMKQLRRYETTEDDARTRMVNGTCLVG